MRIKPAQPFIICAASLLFAVACAAPPVTYAPGPAMRAPTENVKVGTPPDVPFKLDARAEKKEPPPPKIAAVRKREIKKVIDPLAAAETLRSGVNARLSKIPVVGYPPFRAYIRPNKMSVMVKDALPIIRETLGKLPAGYMLRITGHSNQHPKKRRKYTQWMAERRAWRMYNYLVKIGLPGSKMTYRGVANDQPLDPARPRDPRNRRVSFDFVKKSEVSK